MDAAMFDRRRYPTVSAKTGYDEWARTYEATVATGLDQHLLPRIRSVDWAAIDAAADLACGTGRTGVWLKAYGIGTVDGVDISPEMLALAKQKGIYRRLELG